MIVYGYLKIMGKEVVVAYFKGPSLQGMVEGSNKTKRQNVWCPDLNLNQVLVLYKYK